MARSTPLRTSPVLATTITACMTLVPTVSHALIETIALSGQPAPDTVGTNGEFVFFRLPVLNESGQVAFTAVGFTGTSGGTTDNAGIYVGTPAGLTQVVRKGQPVVGGSGTYSDELSNRPMLNDFGNVLFTDTNIQGTTFGLQDNSGIYHYFEGSLQQIYRTNFITIEDVGPASYANNSLAAFSFRSVTESFDDTEIIITRGGTTTFTNIEEGISPPDGNGEFADLVSSTTNVASNASSQVAVRTKLEGTAGGNADDQAIYRSNPLMMITREGRVAPGGGLIGSLSGPGSDPLINASGEVAFLTSLTNTDGGSTDDSAIYRGSGGPLTQIARESQDVPGGDGKFDSFNRINDFNDANQVAFYATINGNAGGPLSDRGIYRGNGGPLTQIVRENQSTPDGNGVFEEFNASVHLNNHGLVVFRSNLRDTADGPDDNEGIFLGDGQEIIRVVRDGQVIDGRTVQKIFISADKNFGARTPINDFGQVAFDVEFTDPIGGVFLFTPELHYRSTFSSSWDTPTNWTVGIQPAHVHDVIIDPAASVTVTGPSTDTAVANLRIGGGTGIATLDLQAGATITPDSGSVIVESFGVLTGEGTIDALVFNAGIVTADNLTVPSGIHSNGLINGSGRINAQIFTATTSIIETNSGDHLRLTSSSPHDNNGLIDISGLSDLATIEIDAQLTNTPTGRIQARGTTALKFDGSLQNDGLVSIGFANATVSGPVTNDSSIAISFSNTTFNAGDLTNRGFIAINDDSSIIFADDVIDDGGAIFIAEGSTAVFLGSYNGSTSGTGHVTIHGDLAPGFSPGLSNFGGDLTFSPLTTTILELAGTTPGTEHDQLNVTGNLNAAGTIHIQLIDGYTPTTGDTFDLLNVGSIAGSFSSLNLPDLPAGLSFDDTSFLTTGQLTVVPEPTAILVFTLPLALALTTRKPHRPNDPFTKTNHPRAY